MKKTTDINKLLTYNRKRSNYISMLRKKNLNFANEILNYVSSTDLDEETASLLERHNAKISKCSSKSMYGQDEMNKIHYVGSHTCKNKLCFICNYNRQKRTRHRYKKFFEENSQLLQIIKVSKTGKIKRKVITQSQFKKNKAKGWEFETRVDYDLMHLTLTVPHDENGWQGEKYYYKSFQKAFWKLRRHKFWKAHVYGGEYGIETTKRENGLNIHAHALIMVKREKQNRNKLHKELLQAWNELTVYEGTKSVDFYEDVESVNRETGEVYFETIANKLFRSNSHIRDDHEYVKNLNPQGARMIRLETIFSTEKGIKIRDTSKKSIDYAIMETISYHFEPLMFDKANGVINIPLLAETAKAVKGLKLYEKFGCLFGEKSLNLQQKKEEEVNEDFAGKETVEDLEEDINFAYFVVDPAFVCHDSNRDNEIVISKKIRHKMRYLKSHNVAGAIAELAVMIQSELTKR
jgi:hypothetical protein